MFTRSAPQDSSMIFDIVVSGMIAANHKQVQRMIAHEVSKSIGITERIFAERLAEAEKANPPAIGEGIAIIHMQISGLKEATSAFIRLKNPVEMDAPDNRGVDIICLLLTPEREGQVYLRDLARLSRFLRNPSICDRLRTAPDEKSLRATLESHSSGRLAA